VRQVTELDII